MSETSNKEDVAGVVTLGSGTNAAPISPNLNVNISQNGSDLAYDAAAITKSNTTSPRANTLPSTAQKGTLSSFSSVSNSAIMIAANSINEKQTLQNQAYLPWGVLKEKPHMNFKHTPMFSSSNSIYSSISSLSNKIIDIESKKPGEYLMHLIMFNFIQLSSKKLEQIVNEKRVIYSGSLFFNYLNIFLNFDLKI
jgi:hypothetical protein